MRLIHNKPPDAIAQWPIHELDARVLPQIPDLAGARLYMMRGCRIIVSREPQGWHLSISRGDREPSWQEIATARYRLLPDVPEMAMFLPPLDEYVNIHPRCFHLYEQPRSRLVLP